MVFSRRNFGRTILAASAGALLTSCVKPAKQVAAVAKPDSSAALSPSLDVVQKSKGPILTTLEEFYKMGPVRQALIPWVPCGLPMISFSAFQNFLLIS